MATNWNDMCLANRDDFQGAGKMAEAAGWIVAPDSLVSSFEHAVGKPQVWLRSSAAGIRLLAIGRLDDTVLDRGKPVLARFCAVGVMPADVAVDNDVKTLLPVPPNPIGAKNGQTTYAYRRTPNGPKPILGDLNDPATIDGIDAPDVDIVQVGGGAKMTLIMLAIPEAHEAAKGQ